MFLFIKSNDYYFVKLTMKHSTWSSLLLKKITSSGRPGDAISNVDKSRTFW